MASKKYFDHYPEFPSTVPVVRLARVSIDSLQNGSPEASRQLFEACRDYGFFLLDLSGSESGRELLDEAEYMFSVITKTFDLPQAELDSFPFNPPKSLLGYKRAGNLPTDDGGRDTTQMYTIGQDDMLDIAPRRGNPTTIEADREKIAVFFRRAHAAIQLLLAHLAEQLDLPSGAIAERTSCAEPSESSVRLLSSHSVHLAKDRTVTLGGHTDFGCATMLFNVLGGLQILPAGCENVADNWLYVRPEKGCALINLGDTMVQWTGGVLRSGLHRVVKPPGQQADTPRLSLAYFLRPNNDAPMARLKGGSVIPPLAEGEEDEQRDPGEWAAVMAAKIMRGEMRPQTTGGRPTKLVRIGNESVVVDA